MDFQKECGFFEKGSLFSLFYSNPLFWKMLKIGLHLLMINILSLKSLQISPFFPTTLHRSSENTNYEGGKITECKTDYL